MTTATINASIVRSIDSSDTSYAAACAGSGLALRTSRGRPGQTLSAGTYFAFQAQFEFDTSSIPADATITGVTLSLDGSSDNSSTDFTVQARLYDFGSSVDTDDWRTPSQAAALPLLATFDTSGYSTSVNSDFTENGTTFRSNINKGGVTRIILVSDRFVSQTAPSGDEYVSFSSTASAHSLTITYTTTVTSARSVSSTSLLKTIGSRLLNSTTKLAGAARRTVQSVTKVSTTVARTVASKTGLVKTATLTSNASTSNWGRITSSGLNDYPTTRAGGSINVSTTLLRTGQSYDSGTTVYACVLGYLQFDTSSIPANATIRSATLKVAVAGGNDFSDTNFTIQARAYDYGTSLASDDYLSGTTYASKPICATLDTSIIGTDIYREFTENGTTLRSNINRGGITRLVLGSDRFAAGTTPSGNEYVEFVAPTASSLFPQLVIVYVDNSHLVSSTTRLLAHVAHTVQSGTRLAGSGTRAVASSALLRATLNRTTQTTTALKATLARTIASNTALKASRTRATQTSTALKATLARTLSSSTTLTLRLVRTVQSTVALKATHTRAVQSTTVIFGAIVRRMHSSTALKATLARSVSTSTALTNRFSRTVNAVTRLTASVGRTINTTTLLNSGFTRRLQSTTLLKVLATRTGQRSGGTLDQIVTLRLHTPLPEGAPLVPLGFDTRQTTMVVTMSVDRGFESCQIGFPTRESIERRITPWLQEPVHSFRPFGHVVVADASDLYFAGRANQQPQYIGGELRAVTAQGYWDALNDREFTSSDTTDTSSGEIIKQIIRQLIPYAIIDDNNWDDPGVSHKASEYTDKLGGQSVDSILKEGGQAGTPYDLQFWARDDGRVLVQLRARTAPLVPAYEFPLVRDTQVLNINPDYSNLFSHIRVAYTPPGGSATVTDWQPDLSDTTFRNQWGFVRQRTLNGGQMTAAGAKAFRDTQQALLSRLQWGGTLRLSGQYALRYANSDVTVSRRAVRPGWLRIIGLDEMLLIQRLAWDAMADTLELTVTSGITQQTLNERIVRAVDAVQTQRNPLSGAKAVG